MDLPTRRSARLKNYDYSSAGWYYVTICRQDRKCLFGKINNGKMELNNMGKIVKNIWQSLPDHHPVKLGEFQIMPNHIHCIIQIVNTLVGATRGSPVIKSGGSRPHTGGSRPAPTLGVIIGLFKSECTKQIRRTLDNHNIVIWQRNYYEHVIRNETDLNQIREYIINNPQIWDGDQNNPKNLKISQ